MQLPLARFPWPRRRPRSRGELARHTRAPSGHPYAPRLPPRARRSLSVGARRPRSLRPRRRPHVTSAAGRAPRFGGLREHGRAEPASSSVRGPAEGARPPPAPALRSVSPGPAAAPRGGGGMEPPPPLPPRSPAEGREGSAPRQDPPLGLPPPPPPLPSLPPRLEPPHAKRERESAGRPERMPPPEPGAAAAVAGRRSAKRRRHLHGAASPARPHGGGADAAGPSAGGPASPPACPSADLVGVPTLNAQSHGSPHPSQSVGPSAVQVEPPELPSRLQSSPQGDPRGWLPRAQVAAKLPESRPSPGPQDKGLAMSTHPLPQRGQPEKDPRLGCVCVQVSLSLHTRLPQIGLFHLCSQKKKK